MKYILISDGDLVIQLIKNGIHPIGTNTDGKQCYYFFEYNDEVISWINCCETIIRVDNMIKKSKSKEV